MTTVEKIKKYCKIKGISIQTLEKDTGLSNGSISKWDKSSPKSESLMKVANYLDVSVDYRLGRVDNPHSEIPVALSAPQGYENLTDEQKELIQALIDQYAQRNKEK